jgi:hypothetical protein
VSATHSWLNVLRCGEILNKRGNHRTAVRLAAANNDGKQNRRHICSSGKHGNHNISGNTAYQGKRSNRTSAVTLLIKANTNILPCLCNTTDFCTNLELPTNFVNIPNSPSKYSQKSEHWDSDPTTRTDGRTDTLLVAVLWEHADEGHRRRPCRQQLNLQEIDPKKNR